MNLNRPTISQNQEMEILLYQQDSAADISYGDHFKRPEKTLFTNHILDSIRDKIVDIG
ncbi:MAG: hypothetical protein JWP89_2141 [Schlesneria sp.]|nr:hypothetical protein [Schlesneria sp.]